MQLDLTREEIEEMLCVLRSGLYERTTRPTFNRSLNVYDKISEQFTKQLPEVTSRG